jgi:hypothetical protein
VTKKERSARAKRSGAKRRKRNAVATAWKKMNPGKKMPQAVRVKRLKGGGFTVTPVTVKKGNVAAGFYDEDGVFHPIRSSYDYSPSRGGDAGGAIARGRYLHRKATGKK